MCPPFREARAPPCAIQAWLGRLLRSRLAQDHVDPCEREADERNPDEQPEAARNRGDDLEKEEDEAQEKEVALMARRRLHGGLERRDGVEVLVQHVERGETGHEVPDHHGSDAEIEGYASDERLDEPQNDRGKQLPELREQIADLRLLTTHDLEADAEATEDEELDDCRDHAADQHLTRDLRDLDHGEVLRHGGDADHDSEDAAHADREEDEVGEEPYESRDDEHGCVVLEVLPGLAQDVPDLEHASPLLAIQP